MGGRLRPWQAWQFRCLEGYIFYTRGLLSRSSMRFYRGHGKSESALRSQRGRSRAGLNLGSAPAAHRASRNPGRHVRLSVDRQMGRSWHPVRLSGVFVPSMDG